MQTVTKIVNEKKSILTFSQLKEMQHIFAPQDTHVHILSIPAWQSAGEKQFPLLVIIRLVLVLFGRINWSQLKWMPSARL